VLPNGIVHRNILGRSPIDGLYDGFQCATIRDNVNGL
jgi:hypothetical protein